MALFPDTAHSSFSIKALLNLKKTETQTLKWVSSLGAKLG